MIKSRNKKIELLIINATLLLFIAVWSIYTLQYTPTPWVDEVYFASVTQSLTEGNGLTLPVGLNQEVYHYGPVYFLLTSLAVLVGGFNLISIRIVGLIFAFIAAFLLYKILRAKEVDKKIAILITILLLFDQLFVYSSHIGRMETVAVSFFMIGWYLYERYKQKLSVKVIAIISLCLLLSFLTTTRSVVIILPLGIALLVNLIKNMKWKEMAVLFIIPIVGFTIWVYASYGSFSSMLQYFTSNEDSYSEGTLLNRFIGGSFIISKTHYPLVLATLLVIVHSIKYKYYKEIQYYLYTILLFYIVVHSTSDTYSVMILPLYYLIIGVGLNKVISQKQSQRPCYIMALCAVGLILMVNAATFATKWLMIESSKEYREKPLVDEWISKRIPEGAIILGSDSYYYSFIDHHCRFKSLTQVYKNDNQFDGFLNNDYRPEYVMYNINESSPDAVKAYHLIELEYIDHYAPEPYFNLLDKIISALGLSNQSTYEGDLYRVIYK